MAQYGEVRYWDDRYQNNADEPAEWYQGYKDLRRWLNPIYFATQSRGPTIKPQTKQVLIPRNEELQAFPSRENCRVLILGCGNSTLGADMLMDGWLGGIVNVDFSPVVIDQMRTKYNDAFYQSIPKRKPNHGTTAAAAAVPPMQFICADMTQPLPFSDNSFDLILCKGSFDAVLCGAGSVAAIRDTVRECVRILAPAHGILMVVTHANPDNRIVFLEHQQSGSLSQYWDGVSVHCSERSTNIVDASPDGSSQSDFVYICRKRADQQESNGKENSKIAAATNSNNRSHLDHHHGVPPPAPRRSNKLAQPT